MIAEIIGYPFSLLKWYWVMFPDWLVIMIAIVLGNYLDHRVLWIYNLSMHSAREEIWKVANAISWSFLRGSKWIVLVRFIAVMVCSSIALIRRFYLHQKNDLWIATNVINLSPQHISLLLMFIIISLTAMPSVVLLIPANTRVRNADSNMGSIKLI